MTENPEFWATLKFGMGSVALLIWTHSAKQSCERCKRGSLKSENPIWHDSKPEA